MIRIIIIVIALLLVSNSVVLYRRSNLNFGTVIIYILTTLAIGYAILFDMVNAYCSHGIGFLLAVLFWIGFALYVIMMFVVSRLPFNVATGSEKAIIVLGAGLNGINVSETLKRRLDSAVDFYNKHEDVTLCVTGSQGKNEIIPEAVAMERYLIKVGVPKQNVLTDPDSPDTYTNIKNALLLFKQNGVDLSHGILITTNHFHCYRSSAYAKMHGIEKVGFAPSPLPKSMVLSAYSRELAAILRLWIFKK